MSTTTPATTVTTNKGMYQCMHGIFMKHSVLPIYDGRFA